MDNCSNNNNKKKTLNFGHSLVFTNLSFDKFRIINLLRSVDESFLLGLCPHPRRPVSILPSLYASLRFPCSLASCNRRIRTRYSVDRARNRANLGCSILDPPSNVFVRLLEICSLLSILSDESLALLVFQNFEKVRPPERKGRYSGHSGRRLY